MVWDLIFKFSVPKRYLDKLERIYDIVGYADKNQDVFRSNYLQRYNGYTHISECLVYDCICITSSKYYEDIKEELEEYGVEPEKFRKL